MRGASSGSLEHLTSIEREKFLISPWPPWKGVDSIKSLDVIDPKEMKDVPDGSHPFSPPLKIVRTHRAPPIKRNAPVLAPFLRERVILKGRLGRCAARPIEHELIPARENIGAVVTDAERNIAH